MNWADYVLYFITAIAAVAAAVQISYNLGHKHGRQIECAERSYACKCCRKDN